VKICACDLVVGNRRGVHSRVATRLAGIAAEFGVVLSISRADETVDCSSILDVLALALVEGTNLTLRADGDRAEGALQAALVLLTSQDDS